MNNPSPLHSGMREESEPIAHRTRVSDSSASVSQRSPVPQTGRPDLHLHVEELVLDGFDSLDRNSIVSSIERELARLMDAGGVIAMAATISHLDAGEFRIASGTRSEIIGLHIAERVHRCLRREGWSKI